MLAVPAAPPANLAEPKLLGITDCIRRFASDNCNVDNPPPTACCPARGASGERFVSGEVVWAGCLEGGCSLVGSGVAEGVEGMWTGLRERREEEGGRL